MGWFARMVLIFRFVRLRADAAGFGGEILSGVYPARYLPDKTLDYAVAV